MRRTRAQAQITREQLLDAALAVFSQQGYHKASLQLIAEQAGVTRGAAYWHFPTGKPQLYTELVTEGFKRALGIIHQAIERVDSPLEKLHVYLSRSLSLVVEDADYHALLLLNWFNTGPCDDLTSGLKLKVDELHRRRGGLAALVQAAAAQGEIDADVDPVVAATSAQGLIGGLTRLYLIEPALFPPERHAPTVELFLRGLGARLPTSNV